MTPDTPLRRDAALLLIALSSVAWSSGGLFVRLLALQPGTAIFWRAMFAGCFLAAISARSLPTTLAAMKQSVKGGVVIVLGTAVATGLFVPAIELTSVAHVALIYATLPIFVALLARVTIGEPLTQRAIIAALSIVAGMAVLTGDHDQRSGWFGDLLAVGVTIAMAIVAVVARRQQASALIPSYALANILVAATVPLAVGIDWTPAPAKFAGLAAFGLLQAGMGCWLGAMAAPHLPAADTALITTLEAPLAPLWVWLFLGETPTVRTVIGGGIIVMTVLAYVRSARSARAITLVPS